MVDVKLQSVETSFKILLWIYLIFNKLKFVYYLFFTVFKFLNFKYESVKILKMKSIKITIIKKHNNFGIKTFNLQDK